MGEIICRADRRSSVDEACWPGGRGRKTAVEFGVGSAREARSFCQQRMGGGEVR